MKKIVGFFIALILSFGAYSVGAQNEEDNVSSQGDQNETNALRNLVERDTYGDNWFISLGGNANLLTAEQDGGVSPVKRIKYGGAFSVGKWFNPFFGARLQVVGGQLRGANYTAWKGGYYVVNNNQHNGEIGTQYSTLQYPMGGPFYTLDEDGNPQTKYPMIAMSNGEEGFWQDFNYATAGIDLLANFSNLFRGRYRENNFVDVVPFIGLGAIHAFSNNLTTPNFTHFMMKIGFKVNFNITDKFSIYLEGQGTATTKEFDGFAGDAFGDGVVNLGLGIQYTFNKRFTSLSEIAQLTADEFDRLNKKINDNRYLIENHQDILERQQDLLDRLKNGTAATENKKEVTTVQVVQNGDCNVLPEYIRFALDSYKIDPTEQYKIVQVADYLKNNADSKLLMIGYADRKTGNPRYNLKLSQNRVETVAAELSRLGVPANRIICEWRGDKEQPFPMSNEWNRVVVMVERK